ncbi:hypothetical protein A0H81_10683 [Grifola frondosa]|uniref:DUF6534 domain-containing protein n=1 Tax=Grifola frondosa TaxID=5627 RepID=A0A1C7LYV6_GRIFR|nr:hypothetical protein A0H81_10683 [Grifola frondosa]
MQVATVWILETIHTGFCMQYMYVYVIWNFGNAEFMGGLYWNGGVSIFVLLLEDELVNTGTHCQLIVIVGLFIQVTVQCFYIRRVWVLSNHSFAFTIPLVFLVLCRFGMTPSLSNLYASPASTTVYIELKVDVATTTFTYLLPEWAAFRSKTGPLVTLSSGMGSSACIDVIVASVMIYYLKRGRSGLTRSDNMLVWLSVYTVNTGALTSFFSVLIVIMFAVQKESLVFLALVAMQSKLYANSFLGAASSLNARQHIRNMLSENSVYPTIELSSSSQFNTTVSCRMEILQETAITGDTHNTSGTDIASDLSISHRMGNSRDCKAESAEARTPYTKSTWPLINMIGYTIPPQELPRQNNHSACLIETNFPKL